MNNRAKGRGRPLKPVAERQSGRKEPCLESVKQSQSRSDGAGVGDPLSLCAGERSVEELVLGVARKIQQALEPADLDKLAGEKRCRRKTEANFALIYAGYMYALVTWE
ncbi:unnamed protein product [Caretta caretta]